MTRRKIFSRRYVICIIIGCCVFNILDHMLLGVDGYGVDDDDNLSKIKQIEKNINSENNRGQCKLPNLPVHAPEIMAFYRKVSPIKCKASQKDWIRCQLSTCSAVPEILAEKKILNCEYYEIKRVDDYRLKNSSAKRIIIKSLNETFTLIKSDFAHVKCRTKSSMDSWDGIVYGMRNDTGRQLARSEESVKKYNVLIFGLDSLSRNAVIRKLPKTYAYLTNKMGAHVLKGYNIVGDGTPQALIPLLTGFTELELPETRRRKFGSHYVNVYPMIWKDYENQGYVTSFNEDGPEYGTFTYRLNGFQDQPTDHYLRSYYLAVNPKLKTYAKLCVGDRPRHNVMLDYTKQFLLRYLNTPKFVFSFHGELSHGSINLVGVADNDLEKWLKEMHETLNLLDNTIVIFMSDHGNRFADVRKTLQGKQEERLPFFSFYFPKSFKLSHSREYRNFVANTERLVTPFDVYESLWDLLSIQDPSHKISRNAFDIRHKTGIRRTRAKSLFKKIDEKRSCADAYIEQHWCTCLNWAPVDLADPIVSLASKAIVEKLNQITHIQRRVCSMLKLKEIKWASKLMPHKTLVRFQKNKDEDGFLGEFDKRSKVSSVMYQLKIVTEPGESLFEASVTYNMTDASTSVLSSAISRVNKYGSQAACIMDTNPDLRKYCYCKV